jgi:hypothetical protein
MARSTGQTGRPLILRGLPCQPDEEVGHQPGGTTAPECDGGGVANLPVRHRSLRHLDHEPAEAPAEVERVGTGAVVERHRPGVQPRCPAVLVDLAEAVELDARQQVVLVAAGDERAGAIDPLGVGIEALSAGDVHHARTVTGHGATRLVVAAYSA